MKKIPLRDLHGNVVDYTKVDDEDFHWLNEYRWNKHLDGYAVRSKTQKGKRSSILMHRIITNCPKNYVVDHINHDGLDNRKNNLRIVKCSYNNFNRRGCQSNNKTSGLKNIYWDKITEKWRVRMKIQGQSFDGGRHSDINDAILSVEKLKKKLGLTNDGISNKKLVMKQESKQQDLGRKFEIENDLIPGRLPLRNVYGKIIAYTFVDIDDYEFLKHKKCCSSGDGYAVISINRKPIRLHRFIMKAKVGEIVDHINFDRLDNRKSNLRIVSKQQNSQHLPEFRNGRLIPRGVIWCKDKNKWRAGVSYNGFFKTAGYFDILEDAISAAKNIRNNLNFMNGEINK